MGKNGIKILMAIFGFMFLFVGRLNAYDITLNSNGGSEVSSPEVDSGGVILNIPDDSKWANHMFLGWFDENGKRFKFVGTVLSGDITLTARWSEFSDIGYYGVIDGKTILIEMMDRNLGATTNDTSNTGSYGYYYQWGNNHGFLPRGESTSSVPLSGDLFGPGNWFVGETFIKSSNDWSNFRNDNLWGGGGDKSSNLYDDGNDRTQRQGPCPDGYHIPSLREWNTLFDLFLVNNNVSGINNFPSAVGKSVDAAFAVNSDDLSAFLNQLKIPFAGIVRGVYRYERYKGYSSGEYAYLWSSTPLGEKALLAEANNNSGVINVGGWRNERAQGIPVRCFKNQSEVGGQAYMFDANGGYFSGGLTGKTEYYVYGIYLNLNVLIVPQRSGYSFDGWYTQVDGGDKIELHQISGSKQLYAHWVVSSGVVPEEDEIPEDVAQDLDIYFIIDDQTYHYTIQDRNPGATSNDISSTGSYGYQYQWGNNYGFLPCGTDGCSAFPGGEMMTGTLETGALAYGPANYYSGDVFIKSNGSDWANPGNDNLWGDNADASGDNPAARQGPCDTGYHVPSSAEWLKIQNAWLCVNNGNPNRCTGTDNKNETNKCAAKIQKDLLLPNVGRRNHSDGKVGMMNAASYWTSSPSGYSGDGFYYNSKETKASNSLKFSPESRARARSVRCVKNVYNTSLTINIFSGTRAALSVYGGKLHYLTDPAKTGYSFGGWYSNLTGNIKIEDGGKIDSGITVLYAKWIASDEYEYVFYASGGIFSSTNNDQFLQIYKDGSSVDLSSIELPIRTGFDFVGWYDKNMENEYTGSLIVSGNLDLYAKWVKGIYTITWKNEDGTVLETDENVEYGSNPSYDGAIPTKIGNAQYNYTFAGWSPATGNVEGDATYTAVFTTGINSYTITWKNEDGTVLETDENVEYGSNPSYDGAIPTKTGNAQYNYTFAGWSPTTGSVTGDATYTAVFTTGTNSYTITWKNEDGTVLETDENVEYGSEPSYDGATPMKTGSAQYNYTFAGWSPTTGNVEGDATYIAVFTTGTNSYTITWKNEDGTVLETDENVEYGSNPSYDGATPMKTGNAQYNYTFAGWSPTTGSVTGDATYTAVFTTGINSYTITWKNEDGTVLETDTGDVEYGSNPSYDGAIPTKTGNAQYSYTFAGWSPTTGSVTGDATYTAVFTTGINSYTITWKNEDGTVLETDTGVEYGSTPSYDGTTPTKTGNAQYNYTFAGWSPATGNVIGDATYTAVFTQTEIGGSVSNKLRKDSCPNGDFSSSYYDGICGSSKNQDHYGGNEKIDDQGVTYSDELQQAYERAYENGITTMSSINDANVYGELSRIEMAKMLSKYAVNVLGKTVEGIGNILFDDVDSELDNKYDNGVSISSEMEVMGVNMPNNKFRPFDLVPRSEFVTAFSRMKYGTTDGKDVYYSTHMDKLKNEEIITKTDPNMMELVGYVMIMFMRSAK